MSDGKIIVSQCLPHISCSAQFTIGHSVISQPLHASHCCPVRGWFAEKHILALHRHTSTQITRVDLWLLGCYWSVLIRLVCSLPAALLTSCLIQCCLKGKIKKNHRLFSTYRVSVLLLMHLLLKFLCNENNEINTAETILDLAFISQCLFEFFHIEMWNNLVAILVFRSENKGYQAFQVPGCGIIS